MKMKSKIQSTRVLIIGGGATGTGLARDLALRGIPCILVEKQDINAGASGGNHGLLHSGARYVASDTEAANECRVESGILKRLAPHCIDDTGGLFVAVAGDNENYIADFPYYCSKCGISATPLDIGTAREMEPALSDRIIAAYQVQDAAIDPFRLSLENISHAQRLGCTFLKNMEVIDFHIHEGRIQATGLRNPVTGETLLIEAEQVVSASGAWAQKIGKLAGISIGMIYSKGTLLVTPNRIAGRVINRLRRATDGDILVPGGTVSILGTTSVRIESPDMAAPTVEEVDLIVDQGAAMVPVLAHSRYIRSYSGVRPLLQPASAENDRQVSRGFALIDHQEDGLENFITITGGKLTTFRLMAEKTADLLCQKLRVTASCKTKTEPLPETQRGQWTEPGISPRLWMGKQDPEDFLLCECEMVPASVVEKLHLSISNEGLTPDIHAIALRSRIGKGPCQGAFCSVRVAAHLYNLGKLNADEGIRQLKQFLSERWRGQHPLLWNQALAQSELLEAIHCGTFCLEQSEKEESF
ncbi:MAG: anaerobic glycerol-3-phosphate dehydrogenase subunit A [Deltaproteobacteria bacterium]|nr:MAG: anaerobic glycerol-3-phosphate dehydrogenase subunit A [Deltaproteobacteria bacterium]